MINLIYKGLIAEISLPSSAHSTPLVEHKTSVKRQQIAPQGIETHPPKAVHTPLPTVRSFQSLATFAVESDGTSLHITKSAMLITQITIATQCHRIALDGHHPMENIVAGGYLCQHRIAHTHLPSLNKQCHIAVVFQERTHRIPPQPQRHRMSILEQSDDFGD